jgi:hypothetical protein
MRLEHIGDIIKNNLLLLTRKHVDAARRPRTNMDSEAVRFRDHANATQGKLYYSGAAQRRNI